MTFGTRQVVRDETAVTSSNGKCLRHNYLSSQHQVTATLSWSAWWLLRFSRPLNCQSVRRFLPIPSCWTWPEQTWEGHCDGRWIVCFTSWHICNVFTGVARPSSALRWLLDSRDWRFSLCVCMCLFSPSGTLCLLHYPLLSFHFKFTTNGKKAYCKPICPKSIYHISLWPRPCGHVSSSY